MYMLNRRGDQVRKDNSIASNENKQSKKTTVTTSGTDRASDGQVANPGVTQDLPKTGPELSLLEITAIYTLTAMTTAYVLSFRKLARSL